MNNNIKKILDDLYRSDPSLKKYETDLIEIIESLVAARPKINFDQSFKNELRAHLLEKFDQISTKGQAQQKTNIKYNFMNKIYYALGALALVMLILLPSLYNKNKSNIKIAKLDTGNSIEKIQARGFGSLLENSGNQAAPSSAEQATGLGGGGGFASNATSVDGKMIAPNPVNYRYVYDGDITVNNASMEVYKKIRGISGGSQLASILQKNKLDNFDISAFNNTQLRSFTINENKSYGYSIYVDLYEGMMFISQDWEKWPQPQYNEPVKIEQIPDDQTVIDIANKFLKDKKIDMSQYGQPTVDDQWRVYYEQNPAQNYYAIPDTISIIYPQIINGREVYEEYGTKFGLRVSISVRDQKVTGAWGISTQKYQSSSYDMETDTNKLKKLVEQGGSWPIYYAQDAKIQDVRLGDPTLEYVSVWHSEGNQSSQLFVPALVFPVLDKPQEGYYYKEKVVVPLAKDIVNSRLNPDQPIGIPVEPMPLMK